MLTTGPPARRPPERPPPPPPRGGRARTVMASDAAQRPLGLRVLSATTTTSQQATRPHPAAAGAGLSPCAGSDRIRHRRAWQHSISCACNSAAPVGRGRRPGRCHEPGTPSQPHPARADGARQAGRRARRISPATPHSCPGRRKRPCSRRSRMQGGRTVRPSSTPWGPARHGCFRTRPLMQIWAPRLTHSDMPSGTLSQVSQQTRRQTRIGTRRRSGRWLRKCVLLHR